MLNWGTLAEEISKLIKKQTSEGLPESDIIVKDGWTIRISDHGINRFVYVDGRKYDLRSEGDLGKAIDEVVEAFRLKLINPNDFANDWSGLKFLQLRLELSEIDLAKDQNAEGMIALYKDLFAKRAEIIKVVFPDVMELKHSEFMA